MNAVIDNARCEAEYVAARIPELVAQYETSHGWLAEGFTDVEWTHAMSSAYQSKDTAELGRLIAAAIHHSLAKRADLDACDEAFDRFNPEAAQP